ncbi:unnamed protein product [Oncorhynchus mykiss]|uniref:Anion exchange protein n=1 Tax=Oncorhynchus mykiss TaxID=8022 RepID=A0A060VR12_ONCMY|nr:unnamed protein product [Oncorhynchus mykiss]
MLKTNFEKEELEGHRTLYIGVHVPLGRKSHRRHRHHGHRHRKRSRERDSGVEDGRESPTYNTPSQRVQFLLGTEDDDEEHIPHDLFTELDEICLKDGEEAEWRETARWLKFEEDVEDGGERWSKPYVATLSLHSLFELRSCILNGVVLLDMRANSVEEVADMVLDQQETTGPLGDEVRRKVRETLLKTHHHQNQKKLANRIPIVRSFADIGKKQSEPHSMDKNGQVISPQTSLPIPNDGKAEVSRENSAVDFSKVQFCGGLLLDIKRKAPHYLSDYTDAVSLQCLASFLFLYCACMSPVITFGGLLGEATEGRISAIESLFGASMTGIAYSLFAGQPLTILGSTGPVLVFEKILYKFCKEYGLSYLSLRTCIGLWTAFLCLVLVATDASSLVCYITRFTEEAFASLICIIFIYEALEKLIHLGEHYPINMNNNLDKLTQYSCSCVEPPDPSNATIQYWEQNNITASEVYWEALEVKDCMEKRGEFVGSACGPHGPYIPDVLFWSVVLFFSTVFMSAFLKEFKFSRYFPTKLRAVISDFAVFITIFTMVLVDYALGVPSPKLKVPSVFKPTRDDRGWLISPLGGNPWWTTIVTVIPALLCTILIFMDQQITAVIINRKEHKLKKGCGYHLDLFVVGVMLGVCSIMGLPWFVAATVLSISHVNSLKLESECSAPGEQPKFLGIREQRFTGLMIFLLMGCSVFMTSVLKYIPMPVLYGVFLYMGASSLRGIQLFDRLKLFGMPAKHQPDFIYLRHVPLRKVHLFTIIQLSCLVMLWVIKTSNYAIVFPMMVLALVFIRKLMDCFFTKREMSWLDDLMPESKKKKLEDAEEEEEEQSILGEEDGVVQVPLEGYQKSESALNITDEMSRGSFGNTWNVNSDNSKKELDSKSSLISS